MPNMAGKLTSREEDYSKWYNELVVRADLAQHSDVKGCMVIKPYGFAIWGYMKDVLDGMFKDTGHVNAYFPLFVPKSYLSKEAAHVEEGFAKECAVVTHYRLKNAEDGSGVVVDEDARLEEELIVRPTSETIIWDTYRNWIQSYRDLPILVISGPTWCAGKCARASFCARRNSSGRKATRPTPRRMKPSRKPRKPFRGLRGFCRKFHGDARHQGREDREYERFVGAMTRTASRCPCRMAKPCRQAPTFLGQNFAKGFRRDVRGQGGAVARLGHVVGRQHHDSWAPSS